MDQVENGNSTTDTASLRLRKDLHELFTQSNPYIYAAPKADNLLEWHYVLIGHEDSIYSGGYYHGKLLFPKDYPRKPPSVYMITPSGRFECNRSLCLSISRHHPETWSSSNTASNILLGLLYFMLDESTGIGSLKCGSSTRERLAKESAARNLKNSDFCELFPELAENLKKRKEAEKTES